MGIVSKMMAWFGVWVCFGHWHHGGSLALLDSCHGNGTKKTGCGTLERFAIWTS